MNPEKSAWCLADFKWDCDTLKYISINDEPGNMTMQPDNDEPVTVHCLQPSEGFKTLGVFLEADGNNRDQITKMSNQSQDWATTMETKKLQPHVVRQSINTIIDKRLTYLLGATVLTEKECHDILQPIRRAGLRGLWLSSSILVVVAQAPIELGGAGITDLFASQLVARVAHLIEHGQAATPTGRLLHTSIKMIKLELGTGMDLFSTPAAEWHSLATDSWIKATWVDLMKQKITVSDPTPNLPRLCEHNEFVNVVALRLNLSLAARESINRCHLFLQVTCISQLCEGNGARINTDLKAYPTNLWARELPGWPCSRRPGCSDWHHWSHLL